MRVFIDGCAINRFALVNVNPAIALAGSDFTLSITPELAAEYRRALDHLFVPSYVKAAIRILLEKGARYDRDGYSGRSADPQLAALSRHALVITDDAKLYRRCAHPGMIAWPDVETHIRAGDSLADLLRRRARALPSP